MGSKSSKSNARSNKRAAMLKEDLRIVLAQLAKQLPGLRGDLLELAEQDWSAQGDNSCPRSERGAWAELLRIAPLILAEAKKGAAVPSSSRHILSKLPASTAALPDVRPASVQVFLSSTFTDTQRERDALVADGEAYLQRLGALLGCAYRTVEMRWGISDEMSTSHRTARMCLDTIADCLGAGPGLAFVFIGGSKYGFVPLPESVDAEVFMQLRAAMTPAEQRAVDAVFALDENAVPAVFAAEPLSASEGIYWEARDALFRCAALDARHARTNARWRVSVTEREVEAGIVDNGDRDSRAFAFLRDVHGMDAEDELFTDTTYDAPAADALRQLVTSKIAGLASARRLRYSADYKDLQDDTFVPRAFLEPFCAIAAASVLRVAAEAARVNAVRTPLLMDVSAHAAIALRRVDEWVSLPSAQRVLDAVALGPDAPLQATRATVAALYGPDGTGKSMVLAKAAARASALGHTTVFRDLSVYQSDAIAYLESLAQQLRALAPRAASVAAAEEEEAAAGLQQERSFESARSEFFEAVAAFKPAGKKSKLVIVLDGLDAFDEPAAALVPALAAAAPVAFVVALRDKEPVAGWAWHELAATSDDSRTLADALLKQAGRTLTAAQSAVVYAQGPNLLRTRAMAAVAQQWGSSAPALAEEAKADAVEQLFDGAERLFQQPLVALTFGLLEVSRSGLSFEELLDLVSLDDDVLNCIFQYWDRPVRRCPDLILANVVAAFDGFLVRRVVGSVAAGARGTVVLQWGSERFRAAGRARYAAEPARREALHRALTEYFAGAHAAGKAYKGKLVPRLVDPQVLRGAADGAYNARKLAELPFHLAAVADWDALLAFVCSVEVVQLQLRSDNGQFDEAIRFARQYAAAQPRLESARDDFVARLSASLDAARVALVPGEFADAAESVATLFRLLSWFDAAGVVQAEVLALREEHQPNSLAHVRAHNLLTNIDYRRGIISDDAVADGEENIARLEGLLGPKQAARDPFLAQLLANLSSTVLQNARKQNKDRTLLQRALALRQRSLDVRVAAFGETHSATARSLGGLSVMHRELGDLDAALATGEESLRVRRAVLPGAHPDVALSLENVAKVKFLLGRHAEGRAQLAEAFAIMEGYYGINSDKASRMLKSLALYFAKQDDKELAVELLEVTKDALLLVQKRNTKHKAVREVVGKLEELYAERDVADDERAAAPEPQSPAAMRALAACDSSWPKVALGLGLAAEETPLAIAEQGRHGGRRTEAPTHAADCLLNKWLDDDALDDAELAAVARELPLPGVSSLRCGPAPALCTAVHGVNTTRPGVELPHLPEDFTIFLARDGARALGGTAVASDLPEIFRSKRSGRPHPKSLDPNYLPLGREAECSHFAAAREWAEAHAKGGALPLHVDVHGRKPWTGEAARGGITVGVGAMQRYAEDSMSATFGVPAVERLRDDLVERLRKVAGDAWEVDANPKFAGRGGKAYRTSTRQVVELCAGKVVSVQLEISYMFRVTMLTDERLRTAFWAALADWHKAAASSA